ncbi:MAG: hypothetical protein RRC07_15505 [Anaerolineae bacterium]|nr:hypothetical protein [Anaerolineae bacterium]
MGHVARLLEAAGTPTVIIASAVFRPRLVAMKLPRLVLTPFPMGRPVGAPGDMDGQRRTLRAALELLASARAGEALVELEHPYRPGM